MRIWLAYFEYCLSMCLKMISKWNYLITHIFPLWAQHQLIHFLCTLNWNETNFIIEIRVKIIPNFHLDYFNCHNTIHVSIHEKVLNNVLISLVFFLFCVLLTKVSIFRSHLVSLRNLSKLKIAFFKLKPIIKLEICWFRYLQKKSN